MPAYVPFRKGYPWRGDDVHDVIRRISGGQFSYVLRPHASGLWVGGVFVARWGAEFIGPSTSALSVLMQGAALIGDNALIIELQNGGIR